jgi:hypothetical protein
MSSSAGFWGDEDDHGHHGDARPAPDTDYDLGATQESPAYDPRAVHDPRGYDPRTYDPASGYRGASPDVGYDESGAADYDHWYEPEPDPYGHRPDAGPPVVHDDWYEHDVRSGHPGHPPGGWPGDTGHGAGRGAVLPPGGGRAPAGEQAPRKRRHRREARRRSQAQAREMRWQRHRFAIPYRTDGPKVTFGVLWFAAIVAAAISAPLAVALVASLVAATAGLQIGHAWFPSMPSTRWWTAAAAFVGGIGGFLGPIGLAAGCLGGVAVLAVYLITNPAHGRTTPQLFDVLVRSSIPAGIAAASLACLAEVGVGAALGLIVLVSAYEAGDFLVGSGSSNAVEGPISGLVSLVVVLFILWIATPAPFNATSIILFGALAAVCCPLGQIFASALLPRGGAWAPALRRIDSYLLAAPLWLLLLRLAPTTSTL